MREDEHMSCGVREDEHMSCGVREDEHELWCEKA